MITEHTYAAEVEVPLNPFPGLRPFEFHESNLYFGRDGQSERMLSKLAARRFVAVVGTSGSGKSSLVRAGLLPALFGGFMTSAGSNWRVALMRPGNDPIENLARALNAPSVFGSDIEENAQLQTTLTEATLRRSRLGLVEAVRQTRMPSNENLLVVVDQFEELFRFARVSGSAQYQNEAAAFVKLLLGAIGQREVPIYVVLTLRSDYLGDCALFWDLPEAINESQYLIPRLTREQRREAISGPVAVCGGDIAPRLVSRLLNDVGDDQDQLPILQHALMRAWDEWRADHAPGEPIDLRHYEAIGTMAEALSLHADEAFKELPDERSRRIAERMFKGLTEKGADNREIRRPIELGEICALTEATEEEVVAVVEPFRREGRSFLMPPASVRLGRHSLIDISHESLIRCWDRLHGWVEEESRSARIYLRLAETAALYEKGEAGLWRDPELQLALNWRDQSSPNDIWARRYHPDFDAAMSFLEKSRDARDREAQEKELARRRTLRRTRLVAAVLLMLLMFSLAVAAYARAKQQEALVITGQLVEKTKQLEQQTGIAHAQRARAQEQKLIAEEQKEYAESAKAKAEHNFQEAEKARKETLEQKQRAEEEARRAHENELRAVAAKAEAERQRAMALKQEQLARVAEERWHTAAENSNNLLYAATLNLAQRAYSSGDAAHAQELLDALQPTAEEGASDSERDDRRGFEWYYLRKLYLKGRDTLEGHSQSVTSVAFSPDGASIATASIDGAVKVWDAGTRSEAPSPKWGAEPADSVTSIAYSHDGRMLAIAAGDTVRLWDKAAPEKEPSVLRGPSKPLYSVAFAPDGRTLAAAGEDKDVWLWRLSGPKAEARALKGHGEMVRALAFSPDGGTLASGGNDKTVMLWDVSAPEPKSRKLVEHTQPFIALSFSIDGATLAGGDDEGKIRLWNLRAPAREPAILEAHKGSVSALAFSPDGRTLASGGEDQFVRVWDTAMPKTPALTVGKHEGIVSSVAFSRDGRVLASGGYDDKVKFWDVTTQPGLATLRGIGAPVNDVAYAPGGGWLATASDLGEVKIWDAVTRRELSSFKAHDQVRSVAVSPDGRWLATGGLDTKVKLWRVGTPSSGPWGEPVVLRGGHTKAVFTVAFSPDSRRLATGGDDNKIKVWDTDAPAAGPLTLEGHSRTVTSVAFSPDGKKLASGGLDGNLLVWDLTAAGQPRGTLLAREKPIWAVAYSLSRDGKREIVATGGDDPNVNVRDVADGSKVGELVGRKEESIKSIAFSPDGRSIATGSAGTTLRLWSASSFRELATLEGHVGAVSSVAFSPDGRTLASGSFDWYVKLWYALTDEEISSRQSAPPGVTNKK